MPFYDVYRDGKFQERVRDLTGRWREDSVAFLIGCSYSFESALVKAGHVPRQISLGRNVPMYKTNVSLSPAGSQLLPPLSVSGRVRR